MSLLAIFGKDCGYLSGVPKGRLLVLPTNIRLGLKWLVVTNTRRQKHNKLGVLSLLAICGQGCGYPSGVLKGRLLDLPTNIRLGLKRFSVRKTQEDRSTVS